MKLSISNIAWSNNDDLQMYKYLADKKLEGLEIAPTRIILENPYDNLMYIKDFAMNLRKKYDLKISSMQSIWYGKSQRIFGSDIERKELFNYTKKAIDFASTIECNNLVMGCPKNRVIKSKDDIKKAVVFFSELGEYAKNRNTVLSIEPNPVIYNTNFINYTSEAFELAKAINSEGFKVNIDLGTVIYNNEDIKIIRENLDFVNHIHISEPNLALIEKRDLHVRLSNMLKEEKYNKFVSIEMGKRDNLEEVKETINYVKEVFE